MSHLGRDNTHCQCIYSMTVVLSEPASLREAAVTTNVEHFTCNQKPMVYGFWCNAPASHKLCLRISCSCPQGRVCSLNSGYVWQSSPQMWSALLSGFITGCCIYEHQSRIVTKAASYIGASHYFCSLCQLLYNVTLSIMIKIV